jgi:pectate lyase
MSPTTAITIVLAVTLGLSPLAADDASGDQPAETGRSVLSADAQADSVARFRTVLERFASTVLEHGRDRYGDRGTPLFVDGLHVRTLEPVRWKYEDQTWVLSNFSTQQPLMRLLDGMTTLTGQALYRDAAEQAAAHVMDHLRADNGLIYWGGHTAWDLLEDRPVGEYRAEVHELKTNHPYYELLYRVNPQATREMLSGIWGGHITDWLQLDYNRHASYRQAANPKWDHAFDQDLEIPFPIDTRNLSFVNTSTSLIHAGAMLAALDGHPGALRWAERLAYRWQQGRHPETGLGGGQMSYWRKDDRARRALGHVHPQITEATMIATYHRSSRYHALPLTQLQCGQALLEGDQASAAAGRRLIAWALDDLKVYAQHAWDSQDQVFRSMLTDGTLLQWQQATDGDGGYYLAHLDSLGPAKPDGRVFWGYSLAYRLSEDPVHWSMARQIMVAMGYGDPGEPDGVEHSLVLGEALAQEMQRQTARDDWREPVYGLYAILDLYQATGKLALLELAVGIGQGLAASQTETGLFARGDRLWARTGDEVPLALLHLAATLAGNREALPQASIDSATFHVRYSGELDLHQRKPGDARTTDCRVFYGR